MIRAVSGQKSITSNGSDAHSDHGHASPIGEARAAIRAGQDAAALRVLRRAKLDTAEAHFTQNLARNLAALARHRPGLRNAIGDPLDLGPYRLVVGPTGHPVPALVEGGQAKALTPGADPIAQLRKLADELPTDPLACGGVALAGIGDGYLLSYLAQQPDGLHGMQQAVYLLESELFLLRAALHTLDHSAAVGPIALERFHWFVGEDAGSRFAEALSREAGLPVPGSCLRQPPRGDTLARAVREAGDARRQAIRTGVERVHARCADSRRYASGSLAELYRGDGDRCPRALLLTSRFTTVLQYATEDVADALRSLGWQTRVVKEDEPWHRTTAGTLAEAMCGFDPDLVFQLDHLRHELSDWFPKHVPFVCWIQDHLPNLTDAEAGGRIGPRDFVLTSVAPMYTELYGYPPRQCIGMSKLTRVPDRSAMPASGNDAPRDDLAFVSNASKTPEKHREELLEESIGAPKFREVLAETCDTLIDRYRRGECVADFHGIGAILDRAMRHAGIGFQNHAHRRGIASRLFEGINNALYRQQAMRWAAEIAQEKGLSLALYGNGWENHPDFAAYARGPIAYGPELEAMTRGTRINLQIVPYFALHQRLLDGLVAGGFFLVRRHPTDDLLPGLAHFLDENFSSDVRSIPDARDAARGDVSSELEGWIERCAGIADLGIEIDVVQWARSCQEAELLTGHREALPGLSEISFNGPAELRERIERFLASPEEAARLADRQRVAIESRLTHEAGMRRMIARVCDLLEREARPSVGVPHVEATRHVA